MVNSKLIVINENFIIVGIKNGFVFYIILSVLNVGWVMFRICKWLLLFLDLNKKFDFENIVFN